MLSWSPWRCCRRCWASRPRPAGSGTRAHLGHLFPYLPQQPGCNKRLRAARGLVLACTRILAASTSLWADDVWVVDSTPVECARSRETVKRSDLAGWAQYGYCASHSRWFWGLRLHLLCTLHGLPVGFALTGRRPTSGSQAGAPLEATPGAARSGCGPLTPVLGERRIRHRACDTGGFGWLRAAALSAGSPDRFRGRQRRYSPTIWPRIAFLQSARSALELVRRELLAQRSFLPVLHADDVDRLVKSARRGVRS